jgi:hypothetical protein
MRLTIRAGAALLAATAGWLVVSSPVVAQDPRPVCPKGSQWARGTGCVSDAVVRQAKRNCLYGPAKSHDWPQCVCNDGGKVAACGD